MTSTTDTINTASLSWGQLVVRGPAVDEAQFWLRHMVGIWTSATHDFEQDMAAQLAYAVTLRAIDRLEGTYLRPEHIDVLFEVFDRLANTLRSNDSNPIRVFVEVKTTVFRHLVLSWEGSWTAGRYVQLSIEPDNYPEMFLEWDTGTGQESSFLGLPSTAIERQEADTEVQVRPLVSVSRMMCEAIVRGSTCPWLAWTSATCPRWARGLRRLRPES